MITKRELIEPEIEITIETLKPLFQNYKEESKIKYKKSFLKAIRTGAKDIAKLCKPLLKEMEK